MLKICGRKKILESFGYLGKEWDFTVVSYRRAEKFDEQCFKNCS